MISSSDTLDLFRANFFRDATFPELVNGKKKWVTTSSEVLKIKVGEMPEGFLLDEALNFTWDLPALFLWNIFASTSNVQRRCLTHNLGCLSILELFSFKLLITLSCTSLILHFSLEVWRACFMSRILSRISRSSQSTPNLLKRRHSARRALCIFRCFRALIRPSPLVRPIMMAWPHRWPKCRKWKHILGLKSKRFFKQTVIDILLRKVLLS